jgi:type IV pilus assembly protein PilY1
MAGLAYDVHTHDIRPDIVPKNAPVTVSTFWLDVMESNDYHEKNQFWMTAKYGGFDTSNTAAFPGGYSEYSQIAPLPVVTWNTGGYKDDRNNDVPDQYYQAGNPAAMAAGLNKAFAKIAASIPSGTSTALALGSSTIAATGNANYAVSFAKDWSGDVVGSQLAVTTTGGSVTTTSTVKWHAHDWLPNTAGAVTGVTPLTASTRIIATSSSAAAGNGVPFEMTNISSAEKTTLGGTSTQQTDVLNYVRGDPSKEGPSPAFRPRTYTLGDITNSKPAVVAAPSFPYADSPLNPGYSAFVSANSGRGPVIYVGANDGMLHAFNASMTSATGGKELFAYVPSFLFNTNVDSHGSPVGLASLVANPLQHHFMVDAQPNVIDVDFARTRASGAAPASSVPSDWHTILTSGLGKGGKGYFTLDVTNPAAITTESAMAGKVLWEASYPHMGYSYGTPLVVKTANYGWTVVLTSGYNNDDGHGYIYLVSPKDGTVYLTLPMPDGATLANPAGLAFVSGYINNYADYTADSLYAGDLLGNVWRVDLRASTFGAIQKFATLADSAGNPQPVTTEPVIATDPSTQTRYVFVGTGRLLADPDLGSSTQQTFYSFSDGNNAAFSTNTTTLTRSDLVDDSASVVGGVTVSTPKRGYFIDLAQYLSPPAGQQPAAERVNVQPVASGGVVSFAANLFGQDPCSTGSGRLFALGYDSGSGGTGSLGNSLLTGATGSAVPALPSSSGPITNVSIVATSSGMLDVLAGTGLGPVFGGSSIKPTKSLNKLNWREVPSVN